MRAAVERTPVGLRVVLVVLAVLAVVALVKDPAGPTREVAADGTITLEGRGDAQLGTVKVRRDSEMTWEAESPFGIGSQPLTDKIDSEILYAIEPFPGNSSELKRGTYRDVDVYADGAWKVVIRPRTTKAPGP